MRLQRLEIAGFKSFPDRAELSFERGVTAIVGPNGCGKSNVVDAIAWVLGEQSARSLRGERMEDIIFGGSDARRPTASAEVRLRLKGVAPPPRPAAPNGSNGHAAAMAAMAAMMDAGERGAARADAGGFAVQFAADEDEEDERPTLVRDIEVARRLFRSGDSEYLIDGEACRLRDVQDLLMNAGLGVKAYSIIEQGKIGQILSARPTDRRQLIEEAAGVTKYKSRRRSAELKLDAAHQNLVRVEDIIFELEKQRGALKRQAAKARRFRRLQDELRRWEKILFARRYRVLAETIAVARAEAADARDGEFSAATYVITLETRLEQSRIAMVEAESRATGHRQAAHARELAIGRLQQQIEFDRQQQLAQGAAAADIAEELRTLDARRQPEGEDLARRREAVVAADAQRDEAAARGAIDEEEHVTAHRRIEGREADVEGARSEVFAAINAATVLRHAVENAVAGRERLTQDLGKLDVEAGDLDVESGAIATGRIRVTGGLDEAQARLAATEASRAATAADLARARAERDRLARLTREREQQVAAVGARLRSLEELDAARAQYGDAARLVLAESNGDVGHSGSVADYIEVDRQYERAVEASLGDLLEHVIVPTHSHAQAGLAFVREREAGRCGFLVLEGAGEQAAPAAPAPWGAVPLSSVLRITGPYAGQIQQAIGAAWLADSFEDAVRAARGSMAPVATPDGAVIRGSRLVQGGGRGQVRGILATKREIKELRETIAADEAAIRQLVTAGAAVEADVSRLDSGLARLGAEHHDHEKAILSLELQLARIVEDVQRLARKEAQIATERRGAEEERTVLQAREAEARASIVRLDADQRAADERFMTAQRALFDARETLEALGRRAAESKAAHAGLVERSAGLAAEVRRMEEAATELETRLAARAADLAETDRRTTELLESIAGAERRLQDEIAAFDRLRDDLRAAEEWVAELHAGLEQQESALRDARRALEGARATLSQLEIARVTAEADLSHLAASCFDTVHATLAEVAAEVDQIEGQVAAPVEEEAEADPDLTADEQVAFPEAVSAEEAIAGLRAAIDRLGPVNMMAIEQFDELETRHAFLTMQRQDLVEAISATGEAITRIDKTTRERFREAFEAISIHFQQTFTTLFGGGSAGLVLLNEDDPLESGVDIIAQPPGKRLQNVQLLSGGEKALTAISLMFGIFKYRPSPFCLLDEIDAPLDDANIGRFVEMLRGMLDHTQFILITHNRRTMEIADRLYGVTMEEPGVSKLISVRLN